MINKMNDEFEIRTYGKSELALKYFPNAETTNGALSNLNHWISGNKKLVKDLKACGMPVKSKFFTPKEVALIVKHLGDPY